MFTRKSAVLKKKGGIEIPVSIPVLSDLSELLHDLHEIFGDGLLRKLNAMLERDARCTTNATKSGDGRTKITATAVKKLLASKTISPELLAQIRAALELEV